MFEWACRFFTDIEVFALTLVIAPCFAALAFGFWQIVKTAQKDSPND